MKVGMQLVKLIKKEKPAENQLLTDLRRTKKDLDDAYENFQNVVDPDLIDRYIYEFNAVQKRYRFLLRQVKTTGYEF